MIHAFTEFTTNALLKIGNETLLQPFKTAKPLEVYAFICTDEVEANVEVDSIPITLAPHSILALTNVQYFKFVNGENLRVYFFNREFYCIKDHDKEVGCAGILFFGNEPNPIITLNEKEQTKFNILHDIFLDELETKDNIQAEMLRMLMARFIIKTTRLLKDKKDIDTNKQDTKTELLRAFNVLVETHFREQHSVQFYADALFKSAKTLSNSFSKFNKSPLKIIHERIILEAKRLLMYTNKTAKEIAFELGFEDASHLSRLFKKYTNVSPSDFKKQLETTS
ncbi:helix-turn-helix domain-containing protein [Seonamhaeicola algicola]|uniref:Helix-turn-helix domain-containing protein n=1 Tax=Seonamhaeicola algicola TaxID=1719036 RepID=A0A5C7AZF1_9FLAO|nr:helix-turn-helix domain-containing protein [Seonamhaeicola algicola]TXE13093.1 helix-turn-helix domain-containing protein [Seonamhaeicola algicola]